MEVITLKAIIVDIDGDYLIIANSRGDFKRIYNNYPGCQIGDEITVVENKSAFFGQVLSSLSKKKALAVAACFLFMIIAGSGIYGYFNPVTYVTVDINPSVEFSLNRYDVVREARGLNEEGKIILGDGREYINKKLDKALNLLLLKVVEAEYLNEDTNTVLLTVSNVNDSVSADKKQQLQEIAQNQLTQIIEQKDDNSSQMEEEVQVALSAEVRPAHETGKKDIKIIVEDTTYEKHKEAEKMAISQGKLVLYEKLKEIKPDVALEQIKKAPVGQIVKELEKMEHKGKAGSEAKANAKGGNKKQDDDKKIWANASKQQLDEDKQQKENVKKKLDVVRNESKGKLQGLIKDTRQQLKESLKEKKEAIVEKKKDTEEKKKEVKKESGRKWNEGINKNINLKQKNDNKNDNEDNKLGNNKKEGKRAARLQQ